jgi:hypothetical protein
MKKKNCIKILIFSAILISDWSCTKKFTEINTNPNAAISAPATNILASGIISVANTLFGTKMDLYYAGSYSGMSVNTVLGDYEYRVDINNGWWSTLYSAMTDFVDAAITADQSGNTYLKAAALTMKAYTAQQTSDMFGAIPYSDAFNGADEVIYPKFDNQQVVYDSLLSELKVAADLFNSGTGDIGAGDFIFNGDVSKWKKFCNSLRLRVAMRMSYADPTTATSVIAGILGDPSDYPIMTTYDDNAYLNYPGVSPDLELWFADPNVGSRVLGTYRLNDVLISTLKETNDPRLSVYALPDKWGVYNGYRFYYGQTSDTLNTSNNLSQIGDRFGNNPKGFSPFMNCAEVYFTIAEAYERSLVTGDAKVAYQNGITQALEENGIGSTAITNFLNDPSVAFTGNPTSDLAKINLQKWVCLFKQDVEAWSEARRTDVPLMTGISQNYAQSHNRPPFRLPYPQSELTLNGTNYPTDVKSVDIFYGDQVWWDTRKNVH